MCAGVRLVLLWAIAALAAPPSSRAQEKGRSAAANCTCYALLNPLAIEFPTEIGGRRKDVHGIPCVTRHGPLPQGAPSVDLVRCERDAEGDPHPTNFTPWRCYPQPAMHSRFSFNYTLRCLMTKDGTPYTDSPAVHAGALAAEVCCSVRYSIHTNAHWNGVAIACLAQICLTVLVSSIVLAMQYVSRGSHPLTRLLRDRYLVKCVDDPFPDTREPLAVAVSIPLAYECAPLAFVGAYFMFNFLLFMGAMALLANAPHAPDLLLVSAIISLGLVFLMSTCTLVIGLSRFNIRTYRWIRQATSKRHRPRKPDFDFGHLSGTESLSKRTPTAGQGKDAEDAV